MDSEGDVLDILVQSRRNTKAAIRLMRKLLRIHGFAPSAIVADKIRSYGSAIRKLSLSAEHEQGLRNNNRAENSHRPFRRREQAMAKFQSPATLQKFVALAVHSTHSSVVSTSRMGQFEDGS